MKHLLTFSILASLLFCSINSTAQSAAKAKDDKMKGKAAASTGKNNTTKQGSFTMQGVYAMLLQVANDGTKDSLINSQQLKIYTDRYMIYAHPAADDSLAIMALAPMKSKMAKS